MMPSIVQTTKHKKFVVDNDFARADFNPASYNKTYYSSVMQDEAALIKWQAGPLDKYIRRHMMLHGVDKLAWMFDAGSGPSVHHLLALEKYVTYIHLSDFMAENLQEIQKWVKRDPSSHNWDAFTEKILIEEGSQATRESITARKNAVRKKIKSYQTLDLKKRLPGNFHRVAPIVTSFFVADSATRSKNIFSKMTHNAFDLVAEDGLFVAAYLGGCSRYLVGRKWFASAEITDEDIRYALKGAGASKVTVWRFEAPELKHEGFDHIFAVVAER